MHRTSRLTSIARLFLALLFAAAIFWLGDGKRRWAGWRLQRSYFARQARLQRKLFTFAPARQPDFTPFDAALAALTPVRANELDLFLRNATILDVQRSMAGSALTAVELTLYFIERIRRLDVGKLHSVIELNLDALTLAQKLDDARRAGSVSGPLHGIPILLKDNIATGDRMHTTAGARALRDAHADRDAFLVSRLRSAGAIILGKLNMSEWANYMAENGPNGFSAVGGQTGNPYGPFDVGGSSSGSGAAAAMRFAMATIGTETYGSIVNPACQNSVVGFKPSVGVVSRDRIVPITDATDTAGPLARTVTDVALVLAAIAGYDRNDPITAASQLIQTNFAAALNARALQGLRIGVVQMNSVRAGDKTLLAAAQRALRQGGAKLRDVAIEPPELAWDAILKHGFKRGVPAYLAETSAPVRTLAEVIAFNRADLALRAPNGQARLEAAEADTMTDAEYDAAVESNRAAARAAIQRCLADHRVDLLVTLDHMEMFGGVAPMAGAPTATVPLGYRASGEPAGLLILGAPLDDARVLAAAYGLEQQLHARCDPPGA